MIMSPASWSLPNALWKKEKAPESTSKLCIYFLTFGAARGAPGSKLYAPILAS